MRLLSICENVAITNPIQSGINKLISGIKNGKVTDGYTGGFSVIGRVFDLLQDEIKTLLKYNIIVRGDTGYKIDKKRLSNLQSLINKSMTTTSLSNNPAKHPTPTKSVFKSNQPNNSDDTFKNNPFGN